MLLWEFDELRRNLFDQPHPVGRAAENETSPVHLAGADRQQNRLAMTAADLECDLRFRQQMNIVPLHLLQSDLADAVEVARCGAVIQNLRRRLRRVLQVHLNRMALAGMGLALLQALTNLSLSWSPRPSPSKCNLTPI